MKYILVLLMTISLAHASETLDKYYKDYNKDGYRDYIAKQRAAAHPKGSGIGTNRYTIRYDKSYRVDKYKRKD